MKIIKPSYEILTPIIGDELESMERFGRLYNINDKDNKITKDSARKFVKGIIKNHKDSFITNFFYLAIKFTCDQNVASKIMETKNKNIFSDVSVHKNIGEKELEFIWPYFFGELDEENATQEGSMYWEATMSVCERQYFSLLNFGYDSEKASLVLPNSLKTEVTVTGTYQDWRFFLFRYAIKCKDTPNSQMEKLVVPLLIDLTNKIPEVFDDIYYDWLDLRDTKEKIFKNGEIYID